jgi:sugar lactone lactonase YvrE
MGQYTIATVAGGALPTTPVPAVQATLPAASGLAVDGAGNVYFSLASQNAVFKIDKSGSLTRMAGAAESAGVSRDVVPATATAAAAAELDSPQGLAVDAAGNLYIAETGANRVRKVSTNGAISTVAGGVGAGYSGDGSPALAAQLNGPTGLALDATGRLYIADSGNYRIRVVSPAGIITTVAGTGMAGYPTNGAANSSNLGFVDSIATDSQGNLYIADRMHGAVLGVTPGGALAAVAGQSESFGYSGDKGPATAALLNSPSGVAVDSAGNLYIADSGNNVIRKVAPNGTITTIAGNGAAGYSGDNGLASNAALAVWGISVDSTGYLYLYGGDSHIRRFAAGETITTIAGGGLVAGSGLATKATLQFPQGVAVDSAGSLYLADAGNNVVRKRTPDGTLTIVAGNGTAGYVGDGAAATSAELNNPDGVAIDSAGNLYIADSGNNVVRKVASGGNISTFAGGGSGGCSYYGSATGAQLSSPAGLAVDSSGNLYIADSGNGCIRKVTKATGLLSNVAGGYTTRDFYLNDKTSGLTTDLYFPQGVAVDQAGNLYIADTGNSCVRKVTPFGAVFIVAGNGGIGYSGDGGPASSAELGAPWGVAVDSSGSVYIADTANQRVRKVSPGGAIATIAGTGTPGYTGDRRGAACAELNSPWSLAVDPSGIIYFSDWGNGVVRALAPEGRLAERFTDGCGAHEPEPLVHASIPNFRPAIAVQPHPDSTSALAGGAYTLGPDFDFSYLSLLKPNLPFVQLIERYLNLASSLASMAETMRGTAGSALLADRSQVLQYVNNSAWGWMMTNPQANLPLTMNYLTASGHSIPFYDTFAPSATGDVFTAADLTALTQFLNIMSPELLQYAQVIVNGPVVQMLDAASNTSGPSEPEISIYGVGDVYDEALSHEIGATVFFEGFSGPLGQEWGALWNQSAANPVWDTVDCYSIYPPRPMPASQPTPWGFTSEGEDFATVFSNWGGDSGTPRVNPSQSSSIMEEAVYRAQQGYPILLEKTLLVASLFTDPTTLQLSLYHYASYRWSCCTSPIQRTFGTVKTSAASLMVGDYTFTIQNGLLTGVTSPASQATVASGQTVNIPALNYTFPTPVPIPAFAASRWGMN